MATIQIMKNIQNIKKRMMIKMAKRKLDKLKKDAEAKYNPPSIIPFDATDPRDIPDPTWEKPGDRQWLAHMSDDCMRFIALPLLRQQGLENISDKTFCRWLRKRGLYTENLLAAYVIENLNREEYNNVERD